MSNIKERGMAFAKLLASVPDSQRERINALNRKDAEEEHAKFKKAFAEGKCSLCDQPLTSFDPQKPCQHWLLKPEGFRKEHMETLAKGYSWSRLDGYLRWVANEEAFAQNINDYAGEGDGKLVETTIKYKNLEWSFSCGDGDLAGHEGGGEHSMLPHYHFQMYVDGKPFIRYSDFHLPLSETDVGFLEHKRLNPGTVKLRMVGGTGMGELLDDSTLENVVSLVRSGETDTEAETAPVELNTMVMAEPGKTIKGEDIYKLIQAAKSEGLTVTSKLRELENVRVETMVSPGPGVVHKATRSGRKERGDAVLRAQDRAWREKQKRRRPNDVQGARRE